MTAAKKIPLNEQSSYAIATAVHRAKVLANRGQPQAGEILPVDGKLHVIFDNKPVPRGMATTVFGKSRIDIPEFRDLVKK